IAEFTVLADEGVSTRIDKETLRGVEAIKIFGGVQIVLVVGGLGGERQGRRHDEVRVELERVVFCAIAWIDQRADDAQVRRLRLVGIGVFVALDKRREGIKGSNERYRAGIGCLKRFRRIERGWPANLFEPQRTEIVVGVGNLRSGWTVYHCRSGVFRTQLLGRAGSIV